VAALLNFSTIRRGRKKGKKKTYAQDKKVEKFREIFVQGKKKVHTPQGGQN